MYSTCATAVPLRASLPASYWYEGSVLQQNFHGALLCVFVHLACFFITALSSAHARHFLVIFPVRPEIQIFIFGRLYGAG